jgi:hypothetical protein
MEYYFWFLMAIFATGISFIGIGRMLADSVWKANLGDFFMLIAGATVSFIVSAAAANLDFIASTGSGVVVYTYTSMWFFAFPFLAMALVDGGFSLVALLATFRSRRETRGY